MLVAAGKSTSYLSCAHTHAPCPSFFTLIARSQAVLQPEFGSQSILSVSSCESILYEAFVVETWPI